MLTKTPKPAGALASLFEPNSIAVVGASDQAGNLGGRVIEYLERFGFPGDIWPVNPRRDVVGNRKCYHTVAEIPELPDMALIAVGAPLVLDALRSCIEAGVRSGIILAGGFAEVGEEGAERQRELTELCNAHGFQLCGPNTVGIINTWLPMTASFASHLMDMPSLRKGNISLVSQSGGTAAVVHALAERAGFGLRYLVSAGNEAILSVADYLRQLAEDPHTDVIGMYLEGARDGTDFLDALAMVRSAGKQVVMLKAGVAEVSARAAAAHTGSLAGEAKVWNAVLAEHGVVPVHSLAELLDAVLMLSNLKPTAFPQDGIAILGVGEFPTAIAADLVRASGLRLATAPQVLHETQFSADLAGKLAALAADPATGSILFDASYWAGTASGNAALLDALCGAAQGLDKALFVCLPEGFGGIDQLSAARIHTFPEAARAVSTIARLVNHASAAPFQPVSRPDAQEFDWDSVAPRDAGEMVISEHDCHRFLAQAGISVAAGRLARSPEQAAEAGAAVAFPVAMKAISASVTHRAAAGLLALDIASPQEASATYDELTAKADAAGVSLDAIYVQHMELGEVEVIVSALRDPVFGVVVTCGAGGTATEYLGDIAIERAPVSLQTALSMLEKLRVVALARSFDPDADLAVLADFVSRFSQLAASAPWDKFALEVNPVKWRADAAVAVDGLLILG